MLEVPRTRTLVGCSTLRTQKCCTVQHSKIYSNYSMNSITDFPKVKKYLRVEFMGKILSVILRNVSCYFVRQQPRVSIIAIVLNEVMSESTQSLVISGPKYLIECVLSFRVFEYLNEFLSHQQFYSIEY